MASRPQLAGTYRLTGHESIPSFLVARVVPALSRSCRLAMDLPVLGLLTWLGGGTGRAGRRIETRVLFGRFRQVFPDVRVTERQLGQSLARIWRAGLATVTGTNRWRACRVEAATVCRVDVALWRRPDLSAGAKRAHALFGPRIAAGRHDAVEFLAAVAGMSRGRCGAALVELEQAGLIGRAGKRRGRRGRWTCWRVVALSTGTQPKGVPLASQSGRQAERAATPKTRPDRVCTEPVDATHRRGTWVGRWAGWAGRLIDAASRPGPTDQFLAIARVCEPRRLLTAAGRAGLAAKRQRLADRLDLAGQNRQTVAAWLLGQMARGLDPDRAARSIEVAIERPGGLDPFVHRTGAERFLPAGPRVHDVAELIGRVAGAREPQARALRVAVPWDTRGHVHGLESQLAKLEQDWRSCGPAARVAMRAGYEARRLWLRQQISDPPACRPFANTCRRTVG